MRCRIPQVWSRPLAHFVQICCQKLDTSSAWLLLCWTWPARPTGTAYARMTSATSARDALTLISVSKMLALSVKVNVRLHRIVLCVCFLGISRASNCASGSPHQTPQPRPPAPCEEAHSSAAQAPEAWQLALGSQQQSVISRAVVQRERSRSETHVLSDTDRTAASLTHVRSQDPRTVHST